MRQLSNGDDSTLGSYRKIAVALFGEQSKAVEFLDRKIKEQGDDEEVIANEGQMLFMLTSMG